MTVLVTGGTGYLGRRLCERLVWAGHGVVVYSRDEHKQVAMRGAFPDMFNYAIGDVRDAVRLMRVADDHAVQAVVHAAALKDVPSCESNPTEAIATNLEGSANVAALGIPDTILVSSDKAVSPVNAYGATKMLAERLFIDAGLRAVRYGNVMGSTGSVTILFGRQRALGKPITVTHLDATRFWMHVDEAVDAIFESLDAEPKTIVVPRCRAFRVSDLALCYAPVADDIKYVGLRPGEKIHETLVDSHELQRASGVNGVLRIGPESSGEPLVEPIDSETAAKMSAEEIADGLTSLYPIHQAPADKRGGQVVGR